MYNMRVLAPAILFVLSQLAAHVTLAKLSSSKANSKSTKGTSSDSSSSKKSRQSALPSSEVCVVGGGPAGTYAAYLLESRGYQVTLLEEAALGGKTVPSVNPDGSENIRHIFIAPSMPTVAAVVEEFGLAFLVDPLPERSIYTAQGQIIPASAIPPTLEQLEALTKFVTLTAPGTLLYPYVIAPTNEDLPSDLLVPFAAWLAVNDLTILGPVLYNIITNYGYDFLEQVPAIYILKYLMFGTFPTTSWRLFAYHRLIQAIGQNLMDVRANSNVESITIDPENGTKIKVHGVKGFIRCNSTIIAFPQTKESMSVVKGLDNDKAFDVVRHTRYYELVVYNEDLLSAFPASGSASFVKAPEPGVTNNEPNIYLRYRDNKAAVVLLNAGSQDLSEKEVIGIVKEHINKIFSVNVPDSEILFFDKHTYFPHVSQEDFEAFYSNVEGMQGNLNVYFTGALMRFELVDSAMQHAKYLVESFFPSKTD